MGKFGVSTPNEVAHFSRVGGLAGWNMQESPSNQPCLQDLTKTRPNSLEIQPPSKASNLNQIR